jgi:hypothetical protein
MATSAKFGVPYIATSQASPEVTHNAALNMLQILQSPAISRGLNVPPGAPIEGDVYIVGAAPTGAWAGRANALAGWFGGAWLFVPGNDSNGTAIPMGVAHNGLVIFNIADAGWNKWSGAAWAVFP